MSHSLRVFSSFARTLKISLRVNLLRSTRQALSLVLMLALAFPPSVLGGTLPVQNVISLNVLFAQIKAAMNGQDELIDPLERPQPVSKKHQDREDKDVLSAKVAKLKTELPAKLEMYTKQRMQLSAIPTDTKGSPCKGLKLSLTQVIIKLQWSLMVMS